MVLWLVVYGVAMDIYVRPEDALELVLDVVRGAENVEAVRLAVERMLFCFKEEKLERLRGEFKLG